MDKAVLQSELQLTKQKNAIFNRLSHEFRTPLTIIQSTAQFIERYSERLTLEQRQTRLQAITSQVQWMTVMLDDILELLQTDEHDSPSYSFALDTLAQDALARLDRYQLSQARVEIYIQPNAGSIHAAKHALEMILTHLLANAIKFSKDRIHLDLSLEGHFLVMQVIDQGIGIRQADQTAIFDPLVRGSNLDEVQGSGVGLAIVSRLVKQMHGTIQLDSIEGVGTTFTIRIPLL